MDTDGFGTRSTVRYGIRICAAGGSYSWAHLPSMLRLVIFHGPPSLLAVRRSAKINTTIQFRITCRGGGIVITRLLSLVLLLIHLLLLLLMRRRSGILVRHRKNGLLGRHRRRRRRVLGPVLVLVVVVPSSYKDGSVRCTREDTSLVRCTPRPRAARVVYDAEQDGAEQEQPRPQAGAEADGQDLAVRLLAPGRGGDGDGGGGRGLGRGRGRRSVYRRHGRDDHQRRLGGAARRRRAAAVVVRRVGHLAARPDEGVAVSCKRTGSEFKHKHP